MLCLHKFTPILPQIGFLLSVIQMAVESEQNSPATALLLQFRVIIATCGAHKATAPLMHNRQIVQKFLIKVQP